MALEFTGFHEVDKDEIESEVIRIGMKINTKDECVDYQVAMHPSLVRLLRESPAVRESLIKTFTKSLEVASTIPQQIPQQESEKADAV